MRQLVPSHVENESRQMFRSISCRGKARGYPTVGRKRWQPGELQQLERSGYAVPAVMKRYKAAREGVHYLPLDAIRRKSMISLMAAVHSPPPY